MAGDWLAARAIPHEVLVWSEAKPASGIQEAARAARYRLLAGWCRERGCLHLLTAHHREDQAETHLIRRRAGSGVEGLAGMAALRELRGLRLVRPLLQVPKARLVALLAAERQPFLSDPSNRNPVFERSRLLVLRELAGAAAPLRIEPGARVIWDRRFSVELPRPSGGAVTLGYLGQAGAIGRANRLAEAVRGDLPRLVYPVLPAIWDEA